MYLHWKTRSASQHQPTTAEGGSPAASSSDSACLTRVTAIPGKLAAVHREAGADPYFTVEIDRTGDASIAHELQVEWPK